MLMSDEDIRDAIQEGSFTIDPYNDQMIQPASIDIHLGNKFVQYLDYPFGNHNHHIDPEKDNRNLHQTTVLPDSGTIVLRTGEFMLGHTLETITLSSGIAARLEGRSSYGRLGLTLHATAGFIDPGFHGQVTLELSNLAPYPIVLRPGARVGQVCLVKMLTHARVPYGQREGSKYQGQVGAVTSLAHEDKW